MRAMRSKSNTGTMRFSRSCASSLERPALASLLRTAITSAVSALIIASGRWGAGARSCAHTPQGARISVAASAVKSLCIRTIFRRRGPGFRSPAHTESRKDSARASARQVALVDHAVDVDRLLQPLQLVVHEDRELLQALDIHPRVRIALPVGVLDVDVDRRAHEAGLVDVALRLLGVGEVVL